MGWKSCLFRKPKGFLLQKALRFALKSLSFSQAKHRLFEQLFTVLKNRLFTYKNLSFAQAFPCGFQKPPIFTNQKPCFYPNFFLFPPKATLFCPPSPIRTTLNLLFAKNTAVLLISALTPYAVKPERRTDSNHCRRYPAKLQLFAKLVIWWMPVISEKITYRPAIWIEVAGLRPACFLVTFCTLQKVTPRSPSQGASRFCKPRISSLKQ